MGSLVGWGSTRVFNFSRNVVSNCSNGHEVFGEEVKELNRKRL